MAQRQLTLGRDDVCVRCQTPVPAGSTAWWDQAARRVTCVACHPGLDVVAPVTVGVLDVGVAGASAQREYERRRQNREERTRAEHPCIGGMLLAVREPPHHEVAFRTGARGEVEVAESLDRRTKDSPAIVLHDRRMPRGRGNIDHIAVGASGVFVIDSKNYNCGRVSVTAPLFAKPKLLIGGRDRTNLIDGLDRQVDAVRAALAAAGVDAPVAGVLCFTNGVLPTFGTPRIRGHLLLYRKALTKRVNAHGPSSATQLGATARALASALPPA